MRLIVCLDDRNGMSFNGRRQSSDKLLCAHIAEIVQGCKLWMSSYSAPLFSGIDADIHIGESFMQTDGEDDFCFVENVNISDLVHQCREVIVYRWNRHYPADAFFPEQMLSDMQMVNSEDFVGSSHERITQEVYRV